LKKQKNNQNNLSLKRKITTKNIVQSAFLRHLFISFELNLSSFFFSFYQLKIKLFNYFILFFLEEEKEEPFHI